MKHIKMIISSPIILLFALLINSVQSVPDDTNQKFKSLLTDRNLEEDSTGCLLCELIVQVVDFQVESEATIEQIRTALFGVCDLLQPGMEEDCKAIIYQLDLQTIIDIVVELGLR